ncbi:MAG: hypothetical protein HLUCCA12_02240 [Rhodobacteraceae bacterium HLUCCA12]|nr:MAG: hypothetical protein HLUCCA12_02240 [Rhodobacteraceae bacterium HLUCCA12]
MMRSTELTPTGCMPLTVFDAYGVGVRQVAGRGA